MNEQRNATIPTPTDRSPHAYAYAYGWWDAEGEFFTSVWYVSPEAMLARLCPEALEADERGMLLHPVSAAELATADTVGVLTFREDLSRVTVQDSTLGFGQMHPGVIVAPVRVLPAK